ncbi:MAG: hypothetical protein ACHQ4F_08550, partial [Candidatus Dormibacteria bacterium]
MGDATGEMVTVGEMVGVGFGRVSTGEQAATSATAITASVVTRHRGITTLLCICLALAACCPRYRLFHATTLCHLPSPWIPHVAPLSPIALGGLS